MPSPDGTPPRHDRHEERRTTKEEETRPLLCASRLPAHPFLNQSVAAYKNSVTGSLWRTPAFSRTGILNWRIQRLRCHPLRCTIAPEPPQASSAGCRLLLPPTSQQRHRGTEEKKRRRRKKKTSSSAACSEGDDIGAPGVA